MTTPPPIRFPRKGMTTGPQLYAALNARAEHLGVPLKDYVRPLNSKTAEFLQGLLRSVTPLNLTIDRVEALLNDQPIPDRHRKSQPLRQLRGQNFISGAIPEPVDRTPCPYCGTRADIGCKHQRAAIAAPDQRLQAALDQAEHALLCAFGQGQGAAKNGGFLSDNPHPYQSAAWESWRAGWAEAGGTP